MMTADAEFWDEIAEKYAAKPVENVPAFERKKEITKALLSREQTILEVGCGTGTLALELAPHVAHIHAVDISGEMLGIARRKADAAGVENVTFHQGTLDEPTPFEAEQFDGACAYSILHLVDDRIGTLQTIFEMLKPGGFFISSTVCLGGSLVPYWAILPVMKWFGKAPPVHIIGRDQMEREIREAGFVNVEQREVGAGTETAFIVAQKPR